MEEEISLWLVYFVIMLPSIGEFFVGLGVVGSIIAAVSWVAAAINDVEVKRWIKCLVVGFLLTALVIGNAIPNTKQMAAIVAGHWTINNEEVRKLPNQISTILDSYISDMQEEK